VNNSSFRPKRSEVEGPSAVWWVGLFHVPSGVHPQSRDLVWGRARPLAKLIGESREIPLLHYAAIGK
jgi:hypothetical protein